MTINRRVFLETAATVAITAAAGAAFLAKPAFAMGSSDKNSAEKATYDANVEALKETSGLEDFVLGSEDAPVTVVEYASLTCGHCANFHNNTYPKVKTELIDTGKVRFVQRMYPLDDLALSAAMVSRCSGESLYYPLLDTFYERQNQWRVAQAGPEIFNIARQAGFTEESFKACLANQELYDGILAQKNHAAEKLGVNSTPTFFFNGKMVGGAMSYEEFLAEVEEAEKR